MSEAKFSPLLSLARHAQRRRMEMQCDPQWVLDVFAERDALRAEVERLQREFEALRAHSNDGGWIAAAKHLPGAKEKCLVCRVGRTGKVTQRTVIAWKTGSPLAPWELGDGSRLNFTPTHWMLCPEPPKVGDE